MFSGIKGKATEVATKVAGFGALAMANATIVYSDAFDDAKTGIASLENELSTLAAYILPLAVVICAISMFFTRDQKKFDVEKKILIGCIAAYALVVWVNKGNLADTIKNLFG